MEKTKKEEPQAAKEKKSMKYAKGDFQLEKKAQGVVLPVSYLLLFLFLLCVFYLFLFFVLLCCDLPAGKKLFKNVDIFRSFSPSVSLPLCRSTSHRRTARVVPPTLLSLFPTFCFFLLHYTTQTFTYTHALDYFAFGPFALFAFVLFLLLSRLFSFCVFLFVVCFVLFLFFGFLFKFLFIKDF